MVRVDELYDRASEETRRLVRDLLEQDATDRAWAGQVGPALTQADAARLLGKTEQAVAKDRRLLRLKTRSGRVAYPLVQFDGRRQLPGVADVVRTLTDVADPLTITAWLTGAHPALDGVRPVDALREGRRDEVLAAARRFAHSAA
jgi:hypothetical protein